MEFQPDVIEAITEMLTGAQLNTEHVEATDEEKPLGGITPKAPTTTRTKFLIRPGTEKDVLENDDKSSTAVSAGGGDVPVVNEYTYEDYEKEFLLDRSEEEVCGEDGRRVAQFQLLQVIHCPKKTAKFGTVKKIC
jgi:hypothetical protein